MAKIYYDQDADLSLLDDRTIGIIGFGSQGHAHAQNLRDSGCKVLVAELPGTPMREQAEKAVGNQLHVVDDEKEHHRGTHVERFVHPLGQQVELHRRSAGVGDGAGEPGYRRPRATDECVGRGRAGGAGRGGRAGGN